MTTDRERYSEFLRSGPLKRVYVDLPERAHTMLMELAQEKGIPMKAVLTLLIANAVEKPKRTIKRSKTARNKKRITKRKNHGKKKAK